MLIGDDTFQVVLTDLKESDKEPMFEWINNKELVEFNSFFKPVTWENHLKWFVSIVQRNDLKIFGIRNKSDELIGSCQLLNINSLSQSAELQIRLGNLSILGKGFGSQAVALLLKYGFEKLKLNRIYLHVFENNIRAIKSYEKNGFITEGILRQAAFVNDKFVNVKIMSILKNEYNQ